MSVLLGDIREALPGFSDCSIDAVVSDPPYGIGFMGKEWDSPGRSFVERKPDRRNTFDHVGGNHNPVDSADAARTRRVEAQRFERWCHSWAVELLRVVKPGAFVLLFGGTRTYHRLACAIEDAGFEIRDSIAAWLYGSGFPKSLDVSKAIDKAAGAEREVLRERSYEMTDGGGYSGGLNTSKPRSESAEITAPATELAKRWDGWGTALKPAWEPIIVARKPLVGTVASNVEQWGVGGLNIDGCRIPGVVQAGAGSLHTFHGGEDVGYVRGTGREYGDNGRFPTNLVFCHHPDCIDDDCAEGCHVATLDEQSGDLKSGMMNADQVRKASEGLGGYSQGFRGRTTANGTYGDEGGASRFFPCFRYEAKAPRSERPVAPDGTTHPTVKPLALMRWLVGLVTPPDGVVLDPFLGSGTTAEAAIKEGRRWIGIERDERYWPLIEQRVARALAQGFQASLL